MGEHRSPTTAFIILGMLILGVNVYSLQDYPLPFCDEAAHANVSYNFLEHGRFVIDIYGGVGSFDQAHATQGRIYHAGKALFLAVFGVSNLAGRLFSLCGWLFGALFVYLCGRELYAGWVGGLAVLIYTSSMKVFFASHVGREEIWVAGWAVLLLYAYLRVRGRPSALHFTAVGALSAIGLDFHPNAVWFGAALGMIAALEHGRSARGRLALGAWVGAGIGAALLIVALRLLPDPQAALANLRVEAASNRLMGFELVGANLADYLRFWRDTHVLALGCSVLALSVYTLVGLGGLALRPAAADRLLVGIWLLSVLLFALLMPYRNPVYGVLWDALAALIIAAGLARAAAFFAEYRLLRAVSAPVVALLLAGPLILVQVGAQGWLGYSFRQRDYAAYVERLRAELPQGAIVLADPILWYGLRTHSGAFFADTLIPIDAIERGEMQITPARVRYWLQTLEVEYVIEDGAIGCRNEANPEYAVYLNVLEDMCQAGPSVEDRWFGAYGQDARGTPARIYHCRQGSTP